MANAALESLCPQCGVALHCGVVNRVVNGVVNTEASCWCFDLPHVVPVPLPEPTQKLSCLCRACLEQLLEKNNSLP